MGAPLRDGLSPSAEPVCAVSSVPASIPSAADWVYTCGEAPDFGLRGVIIWALGRYGDVYGPIPGEMIDREAWRGNMGGASHDLVAYAVCSAEWRDVFPYQPRDPSIYGVRAKASGIEARSDETAQPVQPEGQEPDPQGDAQRDPQS